jgi:hypothetical protein
MGVPHALIPMQEAERIEHHGTEVSMSPSNRRYVMLFTVQAVCATYLFWECISVYWGLIEDLGEPQHFDWKVTTLVLGSVVLLQYSYWYRLFNVALPIQRPRVVLGHIVLFASRLFFIIASALYSFVIFRHLPEIEIERNATTLVWRGCLFVLLLFSVFCFTSELERLGNAWRGHERR